jgi:uncharacterized protein YbcI
LIADPNERPPQHLSRDSLPRAISNAMARIKREFYGKGPARARTYVFDRFLFAMLEDVLTTAETALKEGGRQELVRRQRLAFEDMMTATFTGEVQKLTGRQVVAYHSQIVFDPDMAIEIFVLDRPVEASEPSAHGSVTTARLDGPGEIGDADALPAGGAEPVLRPDRQSGDGPLRSAIANAMVRLTHEYWGKGPVRARTYLQDQFVFCVLEDPLTTIERTLVAGGEPSLVRHVRMEFQEMKAGAFSAEIAELTGGQVVACHSQIVFDPDILFHVFVLEREPGSEVASGADADAPGRPPARGSGAV